LDLIASSKRTDIKLQTVKKGEKLDLDIIIKPDISTDKRLLFQIDSPDYLSVAENTNNLIAEEVTPTPITVTVTSNDNRSVKAKFSIMVEPNGVESIVLSKSLIKLYKGESKEIAGLITVTALPVGVSNAVVWRVENPAVADLSAAYPTYIVAKNAGETKLIAAAVDGVKTAECTVIVVENELPISFTVPADQFYAPTQEEKADGLNLINLLSFNEEINITDISFAITNNTTVAALNGSVLSWKGTGGWVIVRATVLSENTEYDGLYAEIRLHY
jgi:hypothetical protein